jgi:NAD(P)-dependent dehydrogenase (short-subunit alcohol dehydrogenase family)
MTDALNNPFTLQDKKVLVTGASSGIGVSIAVESSKNGAVVILSGRNHDRLSSTMNQLYGQGHTMLVSDLNKTEDIDMLTETIPVLDGIVFCAGIVKTVPVKNITDQAIYDIFQTNIISSIQIIKRILKQKKLNRGASVVFISSVASHRAVLGNSLYSATKGAVNSFSRVLALELAPQQIRVNSIQPGFIRSALLENSAITEEQINENARLYPLGIGKPEDISKACVYLLSDASEWVTGSIITIDGGVTLK